MWSTRCVKYPLCEVPVMWNTRYVKYPLFLSDFNETLYYSADFREILQFQIPRIAVQ
jgi:hypothetical protein